MAKIDLDKLRNILHRNESDVRKVNEIIKEVELELQIEKEERDMRPPMVKKQFVTLISDNEGKLVDQDFASWGFKFRKMKVPRQSLIRFTNQLITTTEPAKDKDSQLNQWAKPVNPSVQKYLKKTTFG
jgi:hypothetical protein